MKRWISGWFISHRDYLQEVVGDLFGCPRQHAPIGDTPGDVQIAHRLLKRAPSHGWPIREGGTPPLASEPDPFWSSFLLFYGIYGVHEMVGIRSWVVYDVFEADIHSSGTPITIWSLARGVTSWPGEVPHPQNDAQVISETESTCD